jgi:transcriptional regulator with XRE-family HTH domain
MTTQGTDYKTYEELSDGHRRLLRQEELILEVTEAIARALKELQVTQSELAERLGKTKGFISQILSGDRNLTLRTLSDVADALECSIQVEIVPEQEEVGEVLEWPYEYESRDAVFVEHANENDPWSNAA